MPRISQYEFKRDDILSTISALTSESGRSPSMREVADVVDVSIATLHSYLNQMREEGLVEWQNRSHRSLRVVS